jgi:uncharacterized protein (DUF2267 family)
MNPSNTAEFLFEESILTTTTCTTTSLPLLPQQEYVPQGAYFDYPQQQQQQYQQPTQMWTQNYPPASQWDGQQQQQQQNEASQMWLQPPCPEVDDFQLDLFSPTTPSITHVTQTEEIQRVEETGDVLTVLLGPDWLADQAMHQRIESAKAQDTLASLQATAETSKGEETKTHDSTLPKDLADFLARASCLEATRQAEMQEKVVQLQVQLQRDLARLAEEEKARREEATTELTVEFKALAKKVSKTSCVAFSFF